MNILITNSMFSGGTTNCRSPWDECKTVIVKFSGKDLGYQDPAIRINGMNLDEEKTI